MVSKDGLGSLEFYVAWVIRDKIDDQESGLDNERIGFCACRAVKREHTAQQEKGSNYGKGFIIKNLLGLQIR